MLNSYFGLSDTYKENIAKILRGTSMHRGCSIKSLKFDLDSKGSNEENVAAFLKTVNSFFAGIMRFEQADGRVIPMVYNKLMLDTQQPGFSSDAIAMAFLILLLYSDQKVPVPLDELTDRLMVIKKDRKDITAPLKELKDNFLVDENKEGGYITYTPTDVLHAIIPQTMLLQIENEIGADVEYKDKFSSFFSAAYIKKRHQVKLESQVPKEENLAEKETRKKDDDNPPRDNGVESETR